MTPNDPASAGIIRPSMRSFLAVALLTAFVGAIGVLAFHPVPEPNMQLITYMLGQLSGFVTSAMGFYFLLNKLNEQATANTGEMLRTMRAQAEAGQSTPLPTSSPPPPSEGPTP